jgi:hypothetical protein
VKQFIDGKAPSFGDALEVKYRQGQKPQLVMYNDEGERAEVLSLTTWNVDTIAEYLTENLASAAAA